MKRYLRRLWAALCGHTLGPVVMGQDFSVRTPDGGLQEFTVTMFTYQHNGAYSPPTLTIEATHAALLRLRNRV